jgi:hypothetical protein
VNAIACSAAGTVEKIVNKFTTDRPGGDDTTNGDGIRLRISSRTAASTTANGTL